MRRVNLSVRERQLLTALGVLLVAFLALRVAEQLWIWIGQVADVLLVFVVAWAVSYLLAPLANALDERTPLNRAGAVVVVYAGVAVVLAGVLALFLPTIVAQLNDLARRAPEYGDRAQRAVVGLQDQLRGAGVTIDLAQIYGTVPERLGSIAGALASNAVVVVSATATLLFNVTLVLIIAFIMLIDGDALWRRFVATLSEELRSEAELFRQSADRSFGGFVRGSLLLGLIYGVATVLYLEPLGVPFAGVLAAVAGLTMVIPFFGPIIAAIPVLGVTLLGAPDRLLWVLVLTIALQQVTLNVIGPRIMSSAIGIHPLFVFLALLLGAKVAGFWGVVLAMPVAGIANTFVRYAYELARGRRTRAEAHALMDAERQESEPARAARSAAR